MLKKKNFYKLITIVTCLLTIFVINGCSNLSNTQVSDKDSNEEITSEVIIPKNFVNVMGYTSNPQSWIDETSNYLESKHFKGLDESSYVDNNGSIVLKLTDDQSNCLINRSNEIYSNTYNELVGKYPNYKVEKSNDNKKLSFFFSPSINSKDLINFFTSFECSAVFQQLYNNKNGDWSIELNVYNCDTGKLVKSTQAPSEGSITISKDDWNKSL